MNEFFKTVDEEKEKSKEIFKKSNYEEAAVSYKQIATTIEQEINDYVHLKPLMNCKLASVYSNIAMCYKQ